MINWKKYVNIHIEPQWPLKFKHKCTKVITTISKKIKYSSSLKISRSITKRFNATKYYGTEYRNLPTPNTHQKGKIILHSEQSLPKTHKLPRAKSYPHKGCSHLSRNPIPHWTKPFLPQISLHRWHPSRKRSLTAWDRRHHWNLSHPCWIKWPQNN